MREESVTERVLGYVQRITIRAHAIARGGGYWHGVIEDLGMICAILWMVLALYRALLKAGVTTPEHPFVISGFVGAHLALL